MKREMTAIALPALSAAVVVAISCLAILTSDASSQHQESATIRPLAGSSTEALQPVAATNVPSRLPANAPSVPANQATKYCDTNSNHRLAVDKARQAHLLALTFYIPKTHDATSPTTEMDISGMRKDLADAVQQIYTGNAARFVTDLYSRALIPEAVATLGAPATRDVSGGVSDWSCSSVKESASALSIDVIGSSWALIGHVGPQGTISGFDLPNSTEHFTYVFSVTDGGVPDRISDFSSDYSG